MHKQFKVRVPINIANKMSNTSQQPRTTIPRLGSGQTRENSREPPSALHDRGDVLRQEGVDLACIEGEQTRMVSSCINGGKLIDMDALDGW